MTHLRHIDTNESRLYLNSRWALHPIRMQKKLTTRGPVTAAGGPQKAWASHETDGVCPGSRRTNRFGRSTWASALFSRAIGQRATKETRRALFAVVVWGGSDETHGYRSLEVPGGREHHTRTTGRVRCLFGLTVFGGRRGACSTFTWPTRDERPASALFVVVVWGGGQ